MTAVSESDFRAKVADKLELYRRSRGRSQAQMAEAAGVSQGGYSNYETGKRDIPLVVAWRIAKELHVSLEDIVR